MEQVAEEQVRVVESSRRIEEDVWVEPGVDPIVLVLEAMEL